MQVSSDLKELSQSKLKGFTEELERHQSQCPDPDLPVLSPEHSPSPGDRTNRFVHQRVHTLILSARQVLAEGGTPGQVGPYCPQGPPLFREDPESDRSRSTSPLRKFSLSNYSLAANRRPSPRPGVAAFPAADLRSYRMPHAVTLPHSGFQALILCGPGIGLSTFTSIPNEYPKALVNVANRPMVWYVLDWCYRMGVTDITLIAPPSSKSPMAAALAQNPYLTSLPSPTPDLLTPGELDFNMPTAELLRLPEVQAVIKSDFLLLPCDLICDISGDAFIESYLTSLSSLGGIDVTANSNISKIQHFTPVSAASGRSGGLSIWYNTVGREESVKNEECDFLGTVSLESQNKAPFSKISDLPKGNLRNLVWTSPMSELLERAEEDKSWKIRQSLLRRYGNVKCLTQYRDSHIYFFPYWVKEFAKLNENFESVSEDLVGTWAKAEWRKPSYRARFGARKIFESSSRQEEEDQESRNEKPIEDELDLLSLSSTQVSRLRPDHLPTSASQPTAQLASRVRALPEDSIITPDQQSDEEETELSESIPLVPPMLSYILSSDAKAPLVRRVDSTPLLLSVSLLLAKLPTLEEATASNNPSKPSNITSSPFAHPARIAPNATIAPRTTISRTDTLIDSNTTIETQCVIKSSVVGSSVFIGLGSRLTNCVIMDGATVGEKCVLTGTVVGKKAKVGSKCTLTNCEVQDGNAVADETESKGEKYLLGGLEDEDGEDMYGVDDEDDMGEDGEGGISLGA